MTNQEKKQYLNSYCELNDSINQKLDELAHLRALATKVTTTLSDMPKGSSTASKEDTYIKLIMLDNEINADIDKYVDMRKEVEICINSVSDLTLRAILYYRYICGKKWEQIAIDMNYNYRWVLRLHGKALSKIQIGH